MSNYKTVRIDNESMKKLEEIAETMEAQLNFKISKASAIEHVINEQYEQIVVSQKRFILNLINESSQEKKLEFQKMLDDIKEKGHEPEFVMDEKGNFIWIRR
ncbi:hypothetical protein ACFYKT_18385 [Cytobacillus sp. FJAT-53684]|uniref:Ribbon-helix-helix protein CopG domain-containing protein n=1 Tax=Cytobacillus mangrovibacter TaxID=3299024 RepID=A0ABW6K5S1_9BACI